jgi:PAS domain S-box-containing protein
MSGTTRTILLDFLAHLFDTSDFRARWHCGNWTAGHGWLHILSDLGVWSAYFAIPCLLGYFVLRRRDIPFRTIFWLFGAFILACGTTHLMEALMFWWPAYRLAGVIKLLTALVSWGTVAALVPTIPRALVLRAPVELEREITARKQAEDALQKANTELERRVEERTAQLAQANASLRESQRREKERADELEAILRATPTPVWIAHDSRCHRITGNPASFELLGLPEGANVSATSPTDDPGKRGFREFRGDQPIPVDELPIQRAARGELVSGAEVKFVFDDGRVRYIYGNAVPLRNPDGSVRGCVGAFADVTALKEAEESLRQNQEIFKLVHQIGRIGHWQWNSLTDENKWSPEIEALYGLPPGGFGGGYQGWARLLHPDDLPRAEEDVRRALETGRYFTEFRVIWPDGSVHWLEARANVFTDGHDKPVRIMGVNMDVTERKLAEEQLAGYSQRLREVAAASSRVHSATTTETVLQVATEDARRIIGTHQSVSSLTANQQWAQAVNARSLSDKYAQWQTYNAAPDGSGIYSVVCRTNKPLRLTQADLEAHPEFRRFGREAGKHPPLRGWLAVPFVGRDGRNLGLIQLSDKLDGGDFTAEDEAILVQLATIASVAVENARLYEGLREADRRKDEFLATLAHELRNPLAPIRNSIELLRRAGGNADLIGQCSRMMERQVVQMVRLVDDLLDISRITQGRIQLRKERVELSAVVQSAVEECRPLIEAQSHKLSVTLPPDPIYLDADPTRLGQVFANLLNNAAKYTEKGGHIWLTAEQQGGEAVVSVRDTGIGIAAEHLPRLFEKFSQVEPALQRSQGGLGIGLSLVRGLVELHGGTVEARSGGTGLGSEFTVRLPVGKVPVEAAQKPSDGERVMPRSARQRRILVVDDNRDAADSLVLMLRIAGHETATAYDGLEAVQAAATFRPDVVLLDIGLPKMNGFEAARHIRQQPWGKGMALLALTGWGQEEDKRRALEAGFDYHLTKPVDPIALEKLLAVLRVG